MSIVLLCNMWLHRLQTHTFQQEVALWHLAAASDARPADMRLSWTGTASTGCRGTFLLRILLTCSNRNQAGQTHIQFHFMRQNVTTFWHLDSWVFDGEICLRSVEEAGETLPVASESESRKGWQETCGFSHQFTQMISLIQVDGYIAKRCLWHKIKSLKLLKMLCCTDSKLNI